jgi:hypothetical protein
VLHGSDLAPSAGSSEEHAVSGQIQYGRAEVATSDETQQPRVEHFSCAVRQGRRKTDPAGRLVLTTDYLHFEGGRDLELAWAAVAGVDCVNRDIVISLPGTRRVFYFCCTTADAAARGASVARDLMALRLADAVSFT